ncbi:MAG TPA: hypothetical protein VG759_21005, partial [Candidatus Angelobacter sp.]|nr:hypothetical protein [Candidatus Angelobacter sp.]
MPNADLNVAPLTGKNRGNNILMRLGVLGWVFAVLALSLALASTADAQRPPTKNDYADRIGMPDFALQHPVEMGFVNLANGNLHLDIPMASFPQRGGSSISLKLTYDSRIYKMITNPALVMQPYNATGSDGGWKVILKGEYVDAILNSSGCDAGGCLGTSNEVSDGNCNVGSPNPGNVLFFSQFSWSSPDGGSKRFPISTSTADQAGGDCSLFEKPNDSQYADDGSGYFMVVTGYTNALVYDRAGNLVADSQSALHIEDTNGNKMTLDANGNLVDSLGRTLVLKTVNGNNTYYDVLNSQGTRSRYTITYATINVNTAFGRPFTSEYTGTITVVQSLTLPSGATYNFGYDAGTAAGNYGLVTSMTLPTGAQIQYGYSTFVTDFNDVTGDHERWVTSRNSAGASWSYAPTEVSHAPPVQEVTLTQPNGESIIYDFIIDQYYGAWNTTSVYKDVSGNTLKTELKEYIPGLGATRSIPPIFFSELPARRTTSYPSAGGTLSTKVEYSYDNVLYGNVSEVREWDWYTGTAPATPARITDATYTAGSPAYLAKNILNKPTSVVVKDGSGSIAAQTQFEYDNYTAGIIASAAVQHDSAFGTGYTLRGNVTANQQWRNTDGVWLTTRNQYDDAGNILSTTDPLNQTTSYDYTDSWTSASGGNTCAPGGGAGKAYVTTITNPLNQTVTNTFY